MARPETFIFIKLFEAQRDERDLVIEVLELLTAIPTKQSSNERITSMKSRESHSSRSRSPASREELNGEEEEDASMKDMNAKIVEMRNLVSAMEELIGIMKSG